MGHVEIAKLLLDSRDCNPNAIDNHGRTRGELCGQLIRELASCEVLCEFLQDPTPRGSTRRVEGVDAARSAGDCRASP